MRTISLRLSESLHERLRELAKQENVSMNQFITLALAEKTAALGHEPWQSLFDSLGMFSKDLMQDREQPLKQERQYPFCC